MTRPDDSECDFETREFTDAGAAGLAEDAGDAGDDAVPPEEEQPVMAEPRAIAATASAQEVRGARRILRFMVTSFTSYLL
jgi:hypothetical protein